MSNMEKGKVKQSRSDYRQNRATIRGETKKKSPSIIVYCSRKKCNNNKNYRCQIIAKGGHIHLKFQESNPYDIHGEFVCKEWNEN